MAQEDKISKFVEAITREAEERRAQIKKETEEYLANEMKKAEDEALSESFATIQRRAALIREDAGRELTKKLRESKKALIARRDGLMEAVVEKVKIRLSAYTKTDAYRDLLVACAKEAVVKMGSVSIVYMREEDRVHGSAIREITGAEIETDAGIKTGGLRFLSADRALYADDTLDARLESRREWFKSRCGLHF